MIGFLLKIVILLVAAVLAYNYFFGSAEEKAQSGKVFGQMKDVAVSVGELAKSEKDKFNAGKYDAALEKLGSAYQAMREGAEHLDKSVLARLAELEQRKANLKKELDAIQKNETEVAATGEKGRKKDAKSEADKVVRQQQRKEALNRELEKLLQDSNELVKEVRKP